jgi:hypothetical protein
VIVNRRKLITGIVSLIAAPAIIRAGGLMPVKVMEPLPTLPFFWGPEPNFFREATQHGTMTVNGQTIYKPDGTPLAGGDLMPSQIFRVALNGGRWIMV